MMFFKILYQTNNKNPPFYKQVSLKKCIIGGNGYSFAIPYSPQSFNTWLMNDEIFKIFVESTVKQLIVSNHKFLSLLIMSGKFNLTLVDCEFQGIDIDDLLEGEKFNSDIIIDLLQDQEYELMKLHFRTKTRHMVTLKSNGVLGIDEGLPEEEMINIRKLTGFVSFGPVMLV